MKRGSKLWAALVVALLPWAALAQARGGKVTSVDAAKLPPALEQKLTELRADIAKRKLRFTVGKTSALDRKLEDLATLTIPAELASLATQQNATAAAWLTSGAGRERSQSLCVPQAAAFDFRTKNAVSGVRDQGSCGSCWAFAAIAAFEANRLARKGSSLDVSEQFALDCAVGANGKQAGSCGGGWYGPVFDSMRVRGGLDEREAPYTGADHGCALRSQSQPPSQPKHKVDVWGFVAPDGGLPTDAQLKEALCRHGPLAIALYVNGSFQAYTGGVWDDAVQLSSPNKVNHAVTLVGWNDAEKAWIVKNSWGTDWGEGGYVRVAYGINNVGFAAAWVEGGP